MNSFYEWVCNFVEHFFIRTFHFSVLRSLNFCNSKSTHYIWPGSFFWSQKRMPISFWRLMEVCLNALWELKVLYKCKTLLVLTNDFCILQSEERWHDKWLLWCAFRFSHKSFFAKNCPSAIHYSRMICPPLKTFMHQCWLLFLSFVLVSNPNLRLWDAQAELTLRGIDRGILKALRFYNLSKVLYATESKYLISPLNIHSPIHLNNISLALILFNIPF